MHISHISHSLQNLFKVDGPPLCWYMALKDGMISLHLGTAFLGKHLLYVNFSQVM